MSYLHFHTYFVGDDQVWVHNTCEIDYVVDQSGQVFPVPAGATGPVPVVNQSGRQTGVAFTGGSGGANGQVSTMRIMDPTAARGGSPGYPNGYIKYDNVNGQGVNPYSGRTVPNSESHYPLCTGGGC